MRLTDAAPRGGKWALRDSNDCGKHGENVGSRVSGVRGGGHLKSGDIAQAWELLAIWARVDEVGRRDLLAVARGLAGASMRADA